MPFKNSYFYAPDFTMENPYHMFFFAGSSQKQHISDYFFCF